jgi:hypothetical protein
MVLIIKQMELSYHVVIQNLFRPLDKEFVVLNTRNISLNKQGREEMTEGKFPYNDFTSSMITNDRLSSPL